MEEFWKPIPTFENRYEVSTEGRVRNAKNGRVLKSSTGSVSFVVDGKPTVFHVKYLMAWTFLGADIADPVKPKVEFQDGDFHNYRLENLRIADYSSNDGEEWRDIEGYEGIYQVSN